MMQHGESDERLAFPILIGDIGGTNARFAVVTDATSDPIYLPVVQTANFPTIDDAIRTTVHLQASLHPKSTVLAVAGPVESDEIPLTNCPWIVKPKAMIAGLGLSDIVVLNDFEAQALASVALDAGQMEKIGSGEPEEGAPRVVLGPGTGLGVAGMIRFQGRWLPIPGEGGHMDIGPRNPREYEIFPHIERIDGRVSGEQVLSGKGLMNVYRAVAAASAVEPRFAIPAEITAAALDGSDTVAVESLELFVRCLARTAGDLAMVFMSQGGVFLTGGIAQKIVAALKTGTFRAEFEDKAPHQALMRQIPVYVITHPLAALAGLAAYAQRPENFGVQTRGRRWRG